MTKQKINRIVGSIGAFIGIIGLDTNHSKFSWCYFRWNHFFDFTLTNILVCIKS